MFCCTAAAADYINIHQTIAAIRPKHSFMCVAPEDCKETQVWRGAFCFRCYMPAQYIYIIRLHKTLNLWLNIFIRTYSAKSRGYNNPEIFPNSLFILLQYARGRGVRKAPWCEWRVNLYCIYLRKKQGFFKKKKIFFFNSFSFDKKLFSIWHPFWE